MIRIHQRNDRLIPYAIKDENNLPVRLDNVEVIFVVHAYPYNEAKIRKTIGLGIDVTDSQNGEIEIDITNADSELPVGNYHYELVVVDIDDHRYTADQGWFIVYKSYERGGIDE